MPTISKLSVNSSLAIPSKHFFKCGCTRRGSLVSDKISSSSSFDRKKNLFQSKGRWQLKSLLRSTLSNKVIIPTGKWHSDQDQLCCRVCSKSRSFHYFPSNACKVEMIMTLRAREIMEAGMSEFNMVGRGCYLLKDNQIEQWFSTLAAFQNHLLNLFKKPNAKFLGINVECPEIHI